MDQLPFLQTFYQQWLGEAKNSTPLEQIVDAYLNNAALDGAAIEKILSTGNGLNFNTPWELLEKWREMLALLLLLHQRGFLESCNEPISKYFSDLSKFSFWREFQLLSAYRTIIASLLKKPCQQLLIAQFPSGACPLESGGHWSWGGIPHPLFHAELGILWCLYAYLFEDLKFLKAAEKLAEWQLNTLDHRFEPFTGLYSREGDVSQSTLLINNFLLFQAVAKMTKRQDLAFVANQQLDFLKKMQARIFFKIPCLSAVMDHFFATRLPSIQAIEYHLPAAFEDAHLALAGCRTKEGSAVMTLFGGGSGMGCLHKDDIQIVNFGPQHLPLGDCQGFGIEGCGQFLSPHVKKIQGDREVLAVEGVSRMAPYTKEIQSHALFRAGEHSGCWIDVKQQFEKGQLSIETLFRRVGDPQALAFAFFVKAQSCSVAQKIVKPRSFQRYQGKVFPVYLRGNEGMLTIDAKQECGELQVIPLGGGDNFWGGDFLIAYLFDSNLCSYCWNIQ